MPRDPMRSVAPLGLPVPRAPHGPGARRLWPQRTRAALRAVLGVAACAGLGVGAPAAADALWFFPGEGPETLRLEDGRVGGVPARRTGWLVLAAADGDGPALAARLRQDPSIAEVRPLRGGAALRVRPARGDEFAASRALRAQPGVAWAHPDLALRTTRHSLPDDPFADDQWHLENVGQRGWAPDADIDAEDAWAINTGSGLVAIIDGGVDLLHPDLDVVSGGDYLDDDGVASGPDDAHGTAAAGLAAARGNNGLGVTGVAQGAQVYAIRLIGGETTLSDVHDAFVEATDAGAAVLSNSWGFDNGCSTYSSYAAIRAGIRHAEENGRGGRGSLVVISAGNGACDNSGDGLLAVSEVVGVGATTGNDGLEWYSSFGSGVDLAAPSGGVLTTDIAGSAGYGNFAGDVDYADFSGTSASAPIVAGAALLMFAANPELTAAQAREALCLSADKIDLSGGAYDSDGWSPWYGCGRLNAGAAVALVRNALPGAPTLVPFAGDPYADRVVLQIEAPADPDGDALRCIARAWPDTDPAAVVSLPVDARGADLTGTATAGTAWTWTASCADGWGWGPDAAPARFSVRSTARPDTGDADSGVQDDAGGDDTSTADDGAPLPDAPVDTGASPERGARPGGGSKGEASGCAGALPLLLLLAPLPLRRRKQRAAR